MKIRMEMREYKRMIYQVSELDFNGPLYLESLEDLDIKLKFLGFHQRMQHLNNDYFLSVTEFEFEVIDKPSFMLLSIKHGLNFRITE